jgi:hypothetical protein
LEIVRRCQQAACNRVAAAKQAVVGQVPFRYPA